MCQPFHADCFHFPEGDHSQTSPLHEEHAKRQWIPEKEPLHTDVGVKSVTIRPHNALQLGFGLGDEFLRGTNKWKPWRSHGDARNGSHYSFCLCNTKTWADKNKIGSFHTYQPPCGSQKAAANSSCVIWHQPGTSEKWEQHNEETIVLAGRKDTAATTTPAYYMSYTTTVSLLLIPDQSIILDIHFTFCNIYSLTAIPDTTYGAFTWGRALGMITSRWHVTVTAGSSFNHRGKLQDAYLPVHQVSLCTSGCFLLNL